MFGLNPHGLKDLLDMINMPSKNLSFKTSLDHYKDKMEKALIEEPYLFFSSTFLDVFRLSFVLDSFVESHNKLLKDVLNINNPPTLFIRKHFSQ